jgi:hypothetical protein
LQLAISDVDEEKAQNSTSFIIGCLLIANKISEEEKEKGVTLMASVQTDASIKSQYQRTRQSHRAKFYR